MAPLPPRGKQGARIFPVDFVATRGKMYARLAWVRELASPLAGQIDFMELPSANIRSPALRRMHLLSFAFLSHDSSS